MADLLNITRAAFSATPNTSIASIIVVTDGTGTLLNNLSVVSMTVSFPDGTTSSAITLAGGGVTSLGSGQYQAKYTTKIPGETIELWSLTAADGVTVGQFRITQGVGY